ncbi:MAG: hypothetical protein ACKVTZ_20540, partial [Bacteroidia bacterium]
PSEIENEILGGGGESKNGEFSLTQLTKFFPKINLYTISQNCPFGEDIFPIFIDVLCSNKEALPFSFEEGAVQMVKKILYEVPEDIFPFENLLSLMWSSNYKSAYLSLYHCIECLYQPWNLRTLYQKLNTQISFNEFIQLMEENSYRKEDKISISSLFSYVKDNQPTNHEQCLEIVKEIKKAPSLENVDEFIYKIRNEIVHLSFVSARKTKTSYSDSDWNELITVLLGLLPYWYKEINSILNSNKT